VGPKGGEPVEKTKDIISNRRRRATVWGGKFRKEGKLLRRRKYVSSSLTQAITCGGIWEA